MNQQQALRRRTSPTCFRVVPSIVLASPDVSDRSDTRGCLRERLAEKEEEAQMNWATLLETRERLTECRDLLDSATAELRAAREREAHLQNRIRRLRDGWREQHRIIGALAGHAERVAKAERTAVEALSQVRGEREPGRVRSVKQALEFAKAHFVALSIPDSVVEAAVAKLDKSGRRQGRGRAVMEALRALHAYALDGMRDGDFKHWCERGGSSGVCYSANRVAMSESVGVQRSERMAHARRFQVDPALDVSGRREMTAHVKLDQGETAPRLYFLDDTRGKTGKIHIGYIGPHLPTARDPK
ncbi:MAG: hypothetical protein F4190_03070 [Acidimicrobiales bacterium]|nr:hypothetical protein [Acidimicrobiales bacterium]MXZ15145.1 hypothetical protein [Acidimicrobiales bacterium]MYD34203.1 hypothetical protein [Acidimicrobiales bacterium]MYG62032.1 hypothetical protein [Acidimicrobiales bacterium]MYG87496.1 hypothetical protein [Acidimicrobiales bacterium]